ncbi:MAG: hypothetical protein ACXVNR_09475, partial [Bacteroidia bacterium]
MIKNFFYILACVVYHSLFSQDNYHYRLSTVHASVSNFSMISAVNPQVPGFSPSFFISVKSLRTDSMYRQEKKIHF